jgi:hypothetical protein
MPDGWLRRASRGLRCVLEESLRRPVAATQAKWENLAGSGMIHFSEQLDLELTVFRSVFLNEVRVRRSLSYIGGEPKMFGQCFWGYAEGCKRRPRVVDEMTQICFCVRRWIRRDRDHVEPACRVERCPARGDDSGAHNRDSAYRLAGRRESWLPSVCAWSFPTNQSCGAPMNCNAAVTAHQFVACLRYQATSVAVDGLASGCMAILESCVVCGAAKFASAIRRVNLTISCQWSRTQEKRRAALSCPARRTEQVPEEEDRSGRSRVRRTRPR